MAGGTIRHKTQHSNNALSPSSVDGPGADCLLPLLAMLMHAFSYDISVFACLLACLDNGLLSRFCAEVTHFISPPTPIKPFVDIFAQILLGQAAMEQDDYLICISIVGDIGTDHQ